MKNNQKAWLVMSAAYLAGVAVTVNQFKVPPVMEILITYFKIDTATGGWLMSSFAVAGVILGFPAAIALNRLGPKWAGLIALGCTAIGSIIGALAGSPALLLISRAIEGIGLGLIIVVSPAVITQWFTPEERGLPMGIWSTWVPVGTLIIYTLTGPLLEWAGWRGIWWFGALVALAVFIFYGVTVEAPPGSPAKTKSASVSSQSTWQVLLAPSSLGIAIAFGAFCFAFITYNTWAPAYLSQGLDLSADQARFAASLASLSIIPSMLLAGWVVDRTQNRGMILTIALFLSGAFLFWGFRLPDMNTAAIYMIVLGLVAGFVPTTTFTLAPETVPSHEQASIVLAMVSIAQNLGVFFGPPIVGAFVAGGNWEAGIAPLVIAAAMGVAASLVLVRRPGFVLDQSR